MESILFDIQDQVAFITLNRPDKFNSFNREMALRMHEALDRCADDDGIRTVCIKGAGKAFCAGQDLNEVVDPNGPELSSIVREHYNPIILKMRGLEKPVVVGVNGVAAGAGANIALAGDIVVAAESASFIQAFSKIGLIPDSGGTYTLPRLIGFQKASALIMLGDKIGAQEAEQLGMIYKWVSDGAFEQEVHTIAKKLATMPTKGLGLTKRALNASFDNNLWTQLDLEEKLQTEAGKTYDYEEGVQAFLEKRRAEFKGK